MDVHKHPHHVMHQKKWPEYFLEFTMLFLAVFLGFIAENMREHSVERSRELEYMHSMVEDLAQDSLEINRVVSQLVDIRNNLDTLMDMVELPAPLNQAQRKKLYDLHYHNVGAMLAMLTQRTLSQLKNAGGLRLVTKKKVADSISFYDSRQQLLGAIFKSFDEATTEGLKSGMKIFDSKFMRNGNKDSSFALLTNDPVVWRQYLNSVYFVQLVNNVYSISLNEQKSLGKDLIGIIQKEYKFK